MFRLQFHFQRKLSSEKYHLLIAVCKDGTEPDDINSPDGPIAKLIDNLGDGPTDKPDDNQPPSSDVQAFDNRPIPSNDPDQGQTGPNYKVTAQTSDNKPITPMQLTPGNLQNVKEVIVTPEGQSPQKVVCN